MVNIKRKGRYCYVENNDCYILYYFFKYRLKETKCYFNKKYLNNVIYILVKNSISFNCDDYISYVDRESKYDFYINLGKGKLELDNHLTELKNNLLNIIGSRKFNQIYNELIKL